MKFSCLIYRTPLWIIQSHRKKSHSGIRESRGRMRGAKHIYRGFHPRLRSGAPMGLGVAMPFCRTCKRFRILLAGCRQVYGKLTSLGDAWEMLGRYLPGAWERLAISDARVCLHRGNSERSPLLPLSTIVVD